MFNFASMILVFFFFFDGGYVALQDLGKEFLTADSARKVLFRALLCWKSLFFFQFIVSLAYECIEICLLVGCLCLSNSQLALC